MNTKHKQYVTFLVGWPLTILAFLFIGKVMIGSLPTTVTAFRTLNIPTLLISIVCFLGYFLIRTYFWQQLLKIRGYNLSLKSVSFSWSFSEIKRYIPGNVWSVATRIHLFGKHNISYKVVLSTSWYEAQYLTVAGASISIAASSFILYGLFPNVSNGVAIITMAIAFIVLVNLLFIFHQSIAKDSTIAKLVKRLFPPFSPKNQLLFLLLNFIALILFGLGTYFSISSFVILPFPHVVSLTAFFVFSLVIGYLSFITPMGLGVREGIITVGLSKYLLPAIAGFAAIFTRLIFIIAEVIFTVLIYIWHKRQN